MLLQTNSYIVPKERRAEHARLLRRFRSILLRLGCEHFEAYEQMGPNWNSADATGRFVQIMRFRDRKHQRAVHAAEQTDPAAQQLINEFCELINLPYQQQQGLLAIGYYTAVPEASPAKGRPPVAPAIEPPTPRKRPTTSAGFGFAGPAAGAGAAMLSGQIPPFGTTDDDQDAEPAAAAHDAADEDAFADEASAAEAFAGGPTADEAAAGTAQVGDAGAAGQSDRALPSSAPATAGGNEPATVVGGVDAVDAADDLDAPWADDLATPEPSEVEAMAGTADESPLAAPDHPLVDEAGEAAADELTNPALPGEADDLELADALGAEPAVGGAAEFGVGGAGVEELGDDVDASEELAADRSHAMPPPVVAPPVIAPPIPTVAAAPAADDAAWDDLESLADDVGPGPVESDGEHAAASGTAAADDAATAAAGQSDASPAGEADWAGLTGLSEGSSDDALADAPAAGAADGVTVVDAVGTTADSAEADSELPTSATARAEGGEPVAGEPFDVDDLLSDWGGEAAAAGSDQPRPVAESVDADVLPDTTPAAVGSAFADDAAEAGTTAARDDGLSWEAEEAVTAAGSGADGSADEAADEPAPAGAGLAAAAEPPVDDLTAFAIGGHRADDQPDGEPAEPGAAEAPAFAALGHSGTGASAADAGVTTDVASLLPTHLVADEGDLEIVFESLPEGSHGGTLASTPAADDEPNGGYELDAVFDEAISGDARR